MCDNKQTFGKQMPLDLAMLLAFSIETVDLLDNSGALHTNLFEIHAVQSSLYEYLSHS